MKRNSNTLLYKIVLPRIALKLLVTSLIFSSILSSMGCSSGGSSNNKRSNQTAVRVFHAGLDAIPVGLFLGQQLIGETRYLSDSVFSPVSPQASILRLSRSNRYEEPVVEFPVDLKTSTEYTVFIYGEVKRGTFQVRLLEDSIVIPEPGMSRIQFLHGLIDQPNVTFRINGVIDDTSLRFGGNTPFIDIPAGEHTLDILDSSKRVITRQQLNAKDQGEMSVLLAGKSSYEFVSVRVYEDFD